MAVKRFEDLIAWQKARELTRLIYIVTREGDFSRDYGLSGQIQRAAVSAMSNIAEGFERNSPNEFYRFLMIAKASCAEVRSQVYVAMDIGYIEKEVFDHLMHQAIEVTKLINGLSKSVHKYKS